ncbi:hypothetical protein [Escherichia coli]|uniref:hypothetical protein n=1 Tax=Escherichia coli TaxID=562 RepID=UPI0003A50DEF|nr:hypothetical protein [Escherichia coli]
MAPFSLLALYGHEQPDCLEGAFPSGKGMNVRLRRTFFSPAWPVVRNDITFPVIILFFFLL